MHRSKIEWVDDTWNPITGCLETCNYCYARKRSSRFTGDMRMNMASPRYDKSMPVQVLEDPFISPAGGNLNYPFGFLPTYHRYRLDYPQRRKNGCNILVGENGEMFGEWVPDGYLEEIFQACRGNGIHNYLFLTKVPGRYADLLTKGILPTEGNFWYGSTLARNTDLCGNIPGVRRFLCIEPILEEIRLPEDVRVADWIIIGAETGNRKGRVVPDQGWINHILSYADKHKIPVYMKGSLASTVGGEMMRRCFPAELMVKEKSLLIRNKMEEDCFLCGRHGAKKKMIMLAAGSVRREMPKKLCYVCHNCFLDFCSKYNLAVPELKELENIRHGG